MARTADLTSRRDDAFRAVTGHNLGITRAFFEQVGGFDESFARYGGEDTEFGYRVQMRGGLLVPARDAFGWHQGRWAEGRAGKERDQELQGAKLAHLVADPGFRPAAPGRSYGGAAARRRHRGRRRAGRPAGRVGPGAARRPGGDLAVCIEAPEAPDARCALEEALGPDPRGARLGRGRRTRRLPGLALPHLSFPRAPYAGSRPRAGAAPGARRRRHRDRRPRQWRRAGVDRALVGAPPRPARRRKRRRLWRGAQDPGRAPRARARPPGRPARRAPTLPPGHPRRGGAGVGRGAARARASHRLAVRAVAGRGASLVAAPGRGPSCGPGRAGGPREGASRSAAGGGDRGARRPGPGGVRGVFAGCPRAGRQACRRGARRHTGGGGAHRGAGRPAL